jgi:two-component system OmpR family response regulator
MSAKRIVLVEDDDAVRTIAQTSLEALRGHEVLACASGAQAVAQAAAFGPDLLLLDVAMPEMDGPQTLAALRLQPGLADTPAVFLTARTQARDVVHYRSLGARDVIAKPFDPAQLCERIDAVLAAAPAVTAAADPAGRAALVVEDDPTMRYLLGFVLKQQGWTMVTAENWEQARAALDDGPLTDAVLMDIELPGGSGLDLLERLRTQPRWNPVPVMMLTGQGHESLVNRALAAGADDYLGKPFDFAELARRLERLHRGG